MAHGRGKRLVVDMIGTRDRAKRAYEMKDLGVDNSPGVAVLHLLLLT